MVSDLYPDNKDTPLKGQTKNGTAIVSLIRDRQEGRHIFATAALEGGVYNPSRFFCSR